MPIDPSIPLSIRPAAVPAYDPLEQYGKVLTLKGLMQQGNIRDIQLQSEKVGLAQAQLQLDQARRLAQEQQWLSGHMADVYGLGTTQPGAALPAPATIPAAIPPVPVTPPAAQPIGSLMAQPQTPAVPAAPPQQIPFTNVPSIADTLTAGITPLAPAQPITPSAPVRAPAAQAPAASAAPPAATAMPPLKSYTPMPQLDYGAILRNMPMSGINVINTANQVANAQLTRQENEIKLEQAKYGRMASIAAGAYDEPSKLKAVATAFNEGLITPAERDRLQSTPYNKAEWDSLVQRGGDVNKYFENELKKVETAKAQEELRHNQIMNPPLEAEAAAKSLQERVKAANLGLRAAIQQGPQSFQSELAKYPTDIQQAFSTAKTPADVDSLATTAQERITAAETKREHDIRAVIDANQEARKQEEHYFTYGAGANAALMNVDPKLRAKASSDAQKYADEYMKANENADRLQAVIDLARSGNKAAFSNLPVIGVQTLNALNGIRRMPKSEIDQYQGAGSLLDKIQGRIGGLAAGQTIPKDVMDDIEAMHNLLRQQAESGYKSKLDSLNQNYRSNFLPVKSRQQGAVGATVKMKAPDGTVRDIPSDQVEHYKSKGATVVE